MGWRRGRWRPFTRVSSTSTLLDAGVKFYASLGNHDARERRFYKPFNMDGQLYYTFIRLRRALEPMLITRRPTR